MKETLRILTIVAAFAVLAMLAVDSAVHGDWTGFAVRAAVLAVLLLGWPRRKAEPKHEVLGEKWDTCGHCGMFQENCWCHPELKHDYRRDTDLRRMP